MAMTTYRVKKDGKEYVYSYDRSAFPNNSTEYNKNYWAQNKVDLIKRAKLKRLQKRLEGVNLDA